MYCRNCRRELSRDDRYCPRCGTPSALGWPVAGAPWLRRPAAVAAFAVLLMAWLFALQHALRRPTHPLGAGTASPEISDRTMARLPEPLPTIRPLPPVRQVEEGPRARRRMSDQTTHVARVAIVARPLRTDHAPRGQAAPRTSPAVVQARNFPAHRAMNRAVRRVPSSRAGGSIPASTFRLAARPAPRPRPATLDARGVAPARRALYRVAGWRSWYRPSWQSLSRIARGTSDSGASVYISARPYGRRTFVYYRGGCLIGETPFTWRSPKPGRHMLLFWTPSLRKRVTRWVTVGEGERTAVSVAMGPDRNLARVE
jgi:hypothetical protein